MPRNRSPFDREDGGLAKFIAALVAGTSIAPLTLILAFLPAWVVMLALGAAHDQWPAIPALGYWTTYILLAGAGFITGLFKKG